MIHLIDINLSYFFLVLVQINLLLVTGIPTIHCHQTDKSFMEGWLVDLTTMTTTVTTGQIMFRTKLLLTTMRGFRVQ